MWAHGGDAIIDAQLQDGRGGRRNNTVCKTLYGIDPLWVCETSEYFAAYKS